MFLFFTLVSFIDFDNFLVNFSAFGGFDKTTKSKIADPRWSPFVNVILFFYHVIPSAQTVLNVKSARKVSLS